jgi:hypothetical protein
MALRRKDKDQAEEAADMAVAMGVLLNHPNKTGNQWQT